jgi:hypothetical protein
MATRFAKMMKAAVKASASYCTCSIIDFTAVLLQVPIIGYKLPVQPPERRRRGDKTTTTNDRDTAFALVVDGLVSAARRAYGKPNWRHDRPCCSRFGW